MASTPLEVSTRTCERRMRSGGKFCWATLPRWALGHLLPATARHCFTGIARSCAQRQNGSVPERRAVSADIQQRLPRTQVVFRRIISGPSYRGHTLMAVGLSCQLDSFYGQAYGSSQLLCIETRRLRQSAVQTILSSRKYGSVASSIYTRRVRGFGPLNTRYSNIGFAPVSRIIPCRLFGRGGRRYGCHTHDVARGCNVRRGHDWSVTPGICHL